MAFTLTKDERGAFDRILKRQPRRDDPWLEPYWSALESGREQGWHQPHAFDAVKATGTHEIGCHSFCHRPLGETTPRGTVVAELEAAVEAARLKGVELSTLVFPRNEVGNLDVLSQFGFIGYRERLARPPGPIGRAISLAAEFNIWPERQRSHPPSDGLVAIPSGYFFNWRFGARRLVPPQLTVVRWKNLLRSRGREGEVVHLWLHPHNLITAPSTADVLDRVLAEVAEARLRGTIQVETQDVYCRKMLGAAEVPSSSHMPVPA